MFRSTVFPQPGPGMDAIGTAGLLVGAAGGGRFQRPGGLRPLPPLPAQPRLLPPPPAPPPFR